MVHRRRRIAAKLYKTSSVVGTSLTSYGLLCAICGQWRHSSRARGRHGGTASHRQQLLLIARLESFGVVVERRTELVGFTDEREHITAYLRGPAGHEDVCAASYIAGCDGARSTCARSSELVFPAAPIGRSSMWLMSRPQVPRSMASCRSISMKSISWPSSPWPRKLERV